MTEARAPRAGLVKTTLLLLPFQLVFRSLEPLLPLLLAYWFGVSQATDVYYFAWSIFLFAGSLVFSAYHDSAIVPIFSEARLRDPRSLRHITGSLLAHTWLFGGALALAIAGGALGWFAFLYDGPAFRLAAWMVPAFAAQLVAMSTKTFFAAVLSAHHRFVPYPVASAAGVVVTLAFVALAKGSLGILAVPVGSLLGELVAAGILAGVVIRALGVVPSLSLERPEPVRRFAALAASEVGGGAVTRVNPVVDQLIAGLAGVAGGATVLRLSNDVASLPTSLLQATFLSVLLAHLAEDFAEGNLKKVRATVAWAAAVVVSLLTASALVLFLVRRPLLRLVFLHGKMNEAGVELMVEVLPYHLVGLASFGLLLVLARANVAVQNSRIMFGMGVLNASMNVVFNLVLLRPLGIRGIALATSLVHTLVAIVFWFRLQKRLRALSAIAARERVEPA